MTRIIPLLLLVVSIRCYGQTKSYSEGYIYSLFKNSILQTEKGKVEIPSNPWLICNQDSAFYRKDTIKVFSNSYNRNSLDCCDYIAWTFYKRDKFIWTNLGLCREPTTASVAKDKDYFEIVVVSPYNYLFISTFHNNKFIESFKVLSIDKIKQGNSDLTSTVLVLVRQK